MEQCHDQVPSLAPQRCAVDFVSVGLALCTGEPAYRAELLSRGSGRRTWRASYPRRCRCSYAARQPLAYTGKNEGRRTWTCSTSCSSRARGSAQGTGPRRTWAPSTTRACRSAGRPRGRRSERRARAQRWRGGRGRLGGNAGAGVVCLVAARNHTFYTFEERIDMVGRAVMIFCAGG
jgi:hypothetical protein